MTRSVVGARHTVWHYQTTPADNWDYTATQHMILTELEINGEARKVILQAPKNGFFYALDRVTGELISAEKYVPVMWANHVDIETGRPVETDNADHRVEVQMTKPASFGGHNWQPMALNQATGLVYIPVMENVQPYSTASHHGQDFGRKDCIQPGWRKRSVVWWLRE